VVVVKLNWDWGWYDQSLLIPHLVIPLIMERGAGPVEVLYMRPCNEVRGVVMVDEDVE
jgi:hypothetical protein